tara:strand:+ start:670 stop:1092 length:423 start_codon:yes stop_codon:yes gene_type:complete
MAKKQTESKVIVIVEDKIDQDLSELENLLRKKDFFVLHFEQPEEFLDYVRKEYGFYNLAIVDLTYSGGDCRTFYRVSGKDAIEIAKNVFPNRPVLCRSNYGDPKFIPHTKANDAITKVDYSAKDILRVVNRLMKRHPVKK